LKISFFFRSGVLQPGDRILAINGQQLEGMTLEDARSIIKESNNQIHLEIEFDVAGNPSFSYLLLLIISYF
jgi:C-terminal processing protease CtpA/Prc